MGARACVVGLVVLALTMWGSMSGHGHDRNLSTSHRPSLSEETDLVGLERGEADTLAFFDFENGLPEGWETVDLTCEPHWHVTTTGAYEGQSYYCAIETPVGCGYLDLWEDHLQTPEIHIPQGTTSLALTFVHKVDTESPGQPIWDGSAIFVSEDGGPFQIVFPQGGYSADSLRGFEDRGQIGTPGWTGLGDVWLSETFDLAEYGASSTIRVRYTFVSDVSVNSFSDGFTGVWVDEIALVGDGDTLFFDEAGDRAPIQMTFSSPCCGDLWDVTDDNVAIHQRYGEPYYPPEGWTPGRLSMVCDDHPLLNAALVSQPFTLPEDGYPRVSFCALVEVPDCDGDGDGVFEDFFDVDLSTAESGFQVWHSLFYDSGCFGRDSSWQLYDWNREMILRLHAYCGQQIRLRWRLHTDADDDGGGGCDWIPCNGRGLFVDDVLLLQIFAPVYDVRLSRIIVPFPNTVGYSTPVTIEVANCGSVPAGIVWLFWELLDENFNRIGDPPYWIPLPPYPTLAAGETAHVTFDWTPTDPGNVYIRAFCDACVTWPGCWDTLTTPTPVHVWESWRAALGYFDRFSPDTAFFGAQPNAGPAVRFTATDMPWQAVALSGITVHGAEVSGTLEVHVFGEGPDDSTLGGPLIEPFQYSVGEPKDTVEIGVGEYGSPVYVEGDFWVHVRATGETGGQFVAYGSLPDGRRSWWCDGGQMQPVPEGWGIIALVRHPAWAWCEGGALGDVNGDGSVNIVDVVEAINLLFEISLDPMVDPDVDRLCRADCNRDGAIDILDIIGIVNSILGLGSCPP